jgi:hypothetical protein
MAELFGSFEEFWAALNRLYQGTVAMQERQDRTDEQLAGLTDRMDRLASMVTTLAGTVAELNVVAERHERRLERLEGQ